jgi:hypothetical protein
MRLSEKSETGVSVAVVITYRVQDTRKTAQNIGKTKSELHKHSLSLATYGTLCYADGGTTHIQPAQHADSDKSIGRLRN